jgi:beta-lactamase class D
VASVDEVISYTGDANPLMWEWFEPIGLRGAMRLSKVLQYQEIVRRIALVLMRDAIHRLGYGNQQIGRYVTSF